MTWADGAADRAESKARMLEAIKQRREDLSRGWRVYRRSVLAIAGLLMVMSVVMISYFADEIAVEHPYRNLQDTEDLWMIDYEPRRASPFSEECDWHEQSISLLKLRREGGNWVEAESDDRMSEANTYYRVPLNVEEIILLETDKGYEINKSHISIDGFNDTRLIIEDDLLNNASLGTVYVTYKYDNSAMHHWWLPDGYDVCIFGTNDQGQDLFSKVLYGSRISLKIGVTVALLTVTLGTIIGSIAGYFGGRIDEAIMRITDIFFAVPGLILAMAFVAALQATTSFKLPMWFAILIPTLYLGLAFRAYLGSLLPSSNLNNSYKNPILDNLLRNRNKIITITILLLLFAGFWSDAYSDANEPMTRIILLGIVGLSFGVLTILDRFFFDRVSFLEFRSRLKSSVDWRNPYKFLAFRTVFVTIAIVVSFRWGISMDGEVTVIEDFDRLWKIQAALIFTGWPGYARLIRGQVLYVKEMNFVEAARSVGAPSSRIMFRHILPNAWAPLLVAFTLDIGGTILSASGLSFIGLGAEPGTAEWGILVSEGRRYFPGDWWLIFFPGIAIGITTLGFNLLGDGLRDVVDPKNRR